MGDRSWKLEVSWMESCIFTKAENDLSDQQIKDFIIGIASAAYEMKIVLFGFIYEKSHGFYTIGPREELEKFKNPIEDFDFAQYIKSNINNENMRFFLYDFTNEKITLNEMKKVSY